MIETPINRIKDHLLNTQHATRQEHGENYINSLIVPVRRSLKDNIQHAGFVKQTCARICSVQRWASNNELTTFLQEPEKQIDQGTVHPNIP